MRTATSSFLASLVVALPLLACGGGGGGGVIIPPPVTVAVNVVNMLPIDPDATPDQSCADVGPSNPDSIVSVTYTPVSPAGAPVTVTFAAPIAPPTFAAIPGGLAPGTYAFQANYGSGALHETDQCPLDDVILVEGTSVSIQFQH